MNQYVRIVMNTAAAAATCLACLVALPCFGQIRAQAVVPTKLADESVVVMDRGSTLDVYLAPRVTLQAAAVGRQTIKAVTRTSAISSIGPRQRAVVFNRDIQQYGYITGEISFALKSAVGATPSWFASFAPKIARLGHLNLYVVNAGSVSEFVQSMSLLSENADVDWVEPIVTYGGAPVVSTTTTR